ncbi:MAG: cation-transporting P-type ATPase, partial [Acidiferrobacterales bacterium]
MTDFELPSLQYLQVAIVNGDRSDWHAIETAEVTRRLAVDPEKGLEEPEAAARLETFGPNRPTAPSAR